MEQPTILFVDDEEPILRSLQRSLRKEPYRVLTASGGRAGLEVLDREEVQLVVSDQRMPEMTGTEFLREVQVRNPDIVRVILSGYAEAHIIVEAINSGGIYRFLAKPWNDDELKANLLQCLNHHRICAENRRLSELSARQVHELALLNERLELAVSERTRSLAMAQDVLDSLPRMVLGVSRERDLVVANGAALAGLPDIASAPLGTDIAELLPPACVEAIAGCLESGRDARLGTVWNGQNYSVDVALLGRPEDPRGCVLVLESRQP